MLDLEDGVDALSGRRRTGALTMAGRTLALALLGMVVVLTIYVLL